MKQFLLLRAGILQSRAPAVLVASAVMLSLFALVQAVPAHAATAYSLWDSSVVPTTASCNDTQEVEVGVKFQSEKDGVIRAIRFYKGAENTDAHVASLWDSNGTQIASAPFINETESGWQEVTFTPPIPVEADSVYVASYHAPNGGYAADNNYFVNSVENGPLTAPSSSVAGGNGVYAYGPIAFPDQSYQATNYWVDVVFEESVSQESFALYGPETTVVNAVANDTSTVELGTRFSVNEEGYYATKIRYYRGGSASMVENRVYLYDSSCALVGQGQFIGEGGPSGWVDVQLTTPVLLESNELYTASYLANGGKYAYEYDAFDQAVTVGPITAPSSNEVGGNGVYSYGNAGGQCPTSTYQSSSYYVSPVVSKSTSTPVIPPPPPEQVEPTVTITTPTDGQTVAANTYFYVHGTVTDEPVTSQMDVTIYVDGVEGDMLQNVSIGSGFNFSVSLLPGLHTIRVEAVDVANNVGMNEVTVTAQ